MSGVSGRPEPVSSGSRGTISSITSRAAFRSTPDLRGPPCIGSAPADDEAVRGIGFGRSDNTRARTRTPVEVRWYNRQSSIDFIGREALAAEIAKPRRTTVTLRWNADDVITPSRPCPPWRDTPIDLPRRRSGGRRHTRHALAGREIGYSSGTIYSSGFREFLSLGCIDIGAARLGNEVVVQWGDHGGEIKNIRATVARFPYLADGRNSDLEGATISAG
jgi:glycine cleavage system aminomethyltransferase T